MNKVIVRTAKNGRRKIRLWLKDPHCFWCGIETTISKRTRYAIQYSHTATIDHLDSKYVRMSHIIIPDGSRTVLSCYKCNMQRNNREFEMLGFKYRGLKKLFNDFRRKLVSMCYTQDHVNRRGFPYYIILKICKALPKYDIRVRGKNLQREFSTLRFRQRSPDNESLPGQTRTVEF